MMFGTREQFDYVECGNCGTLQIAVIPDLTKYYPKEYYSFETRSPNGLREKLSRRLLSAHIKFRSNPMNRRLSGIASALRKRLERLDFDSRLLDLGSGALSLIRSGVGTGSRILDVGCGSGALLATLETLGFSSLSGIDAYIECDRRLRGGSRISKASLDQLDEKFDLIMFHHSFEHMPDPIGVLRSANDRLNTNGICLVRIPLINQAWENYGVNWVGLDPPRHLYLFRESGFRLIAEKAGFEVENVIYDSTSFQFSGSERYSQDIPLFGSVLDKDLFTAKQIKEWRRAAAELNAEHKGDQAAFYLRRK